MVVFKWEGNVCMRRDEFVCVMCVVHMCVCMCAHVWKGGGEV